MDDKKAEINDNIDTSNIFDDFIDDSSLINEVDKIQKDKDRDLFFYIVKAGYVLQITFGLFIVVTLIMFSYISIQNNAEFKKSALIDPFCSVFLGEVVNKDSLCSSISYLKSEYTSNLADIKKTQFVDTLGLLEKIYKVENFTKTKDFLFLTNKSENKLQVLSILKEFDDIKKQFDLEKEKIECSSLSIDSNDNSLSMQCIAYSSRYESGIKGFDGTDNNTISGTSISLANSFINFIEKQSNVFTVIDRQKLFTYGSVNGANTNFTNKSSFSLKLIYNLK